MQKEVQMDVQKDDQFVYSLRTCQIIKHKNNNARIPTNGTLPNPCPYHFVKREDEICTDGKGHQLFYALISC